MSQYGGLCINPYHTSNQALSKNRKVRKYESKKMILSLATIREDPTFFQYVVFSDKALFHQNGQLNRHNCHF